MMLRDYFERSGLAGLALRLRQAVWEPAGHRLVQSKYGVLLNENADDATFRFYVQGDYGFFYADYLRAIKTRFVFVDIGANQGLYSLIAAQNSNCVKAISLEPVPSTFALLTDNILANRLAGKITPLRCGLSADAGTAVINFSPGHSGMASLHVRPEGALPQKIRLAKAAVLEPHIPDGLPLVVKIDTEGHEQVVLDELARSRLAGRISSIFYEMDHRWSDPEAIGSVVRGMGLGHVRNIGRGGHYDVLASREASIEDWVLRLAEAGARA